MAQVSDAASPQQVEDYVKRGLDHLWIHTAQYNDLAKDDGMLVVESGGGISIAPPLIINREQVDELVDMIDQAIGNLERELGLG